jgi:hypothetical protein
MKGNRDGNIRKYNGGKRANHVMRSGGSRSMGLISMVKHTKLLTQ